VLISWRKVIVESATWRTGSLILVTTLTLTGCVSSGAFDEFRAKQDRRAQVGQQGREELAKHIAKLDERVSSLEAALSDAQSLASSDHARVNDLGRMLEIAQRELDILQLAIERSR